jgi:predicted phage baseplate assembly protein
MALISPILDNRSYQQLRDELVKRIPVYAPEWTDHNESNPGIALLELFAYLGESLLYRFNQIPDTTKLEFLRLLGVQPRTAMTARALLAVSTEVPAGVQILRGTEAKAGSVSFETADEVYAWPLDAVAVGKIPAAAATTAADKERRDDARARLRLSPAAAADFYDTVEVPANPVAAEAVPLDVSATLDHSLWIALLRKQTSDLTRLPGRTLFVGVAFDETIDRPFDLVSLDAQQAAHYGAGNATADPGTRTLAAAPPAMIWRLWSGPPGARGTAPAFTSLNVLGDSTEGMSASGVVRLEMPAAWPAYDASVPPPGDADSPPPLRDEKKAALVAAWIQVSRPATENDTIHRVAWVGLNAVSVEQTRTAAAAELLGTGTGDADQQYSLSKQRVLPGTVHLQVEGVDGWQDWQETDWFGGGPDDTSFTVDYTTGIVRFGDGSQARAPQIGERIRVLSYRYGGGAAGNVGAKAINTITGVAAVKAANPMPAAGGAEPATLTAAMDAIPAVVHRHDRAVTESDFRDLAREVAGVARGETLALLHPDSPGIRAAGVLSVVVFPDKDLRNPAAPLPDHALLRRVAEYLDARRLVTTELYVIPPTYKPISVSVGVQVRDGYQVDAVRRWAELIVRQYLAPLPPYGPDGGGWPLGRAVRRAELEAVAVQVEGVEFLTGLLLAEPGAAGPAELVTLERWEAPQIVDVTVVAGPPLPTGTPYQPAPPSTTPVPLPPDVC